MLLGSTKQWGGAAPRPAPVRPAKTLAGSALEWCCLGFVLCLIYKLAVLGVALLAVMALLGLFSAVGTRFHYSVTGFFAILYVALATVTAFQVSPHEGLYRASQFFLLLFASLSVARHFSRLPPEQVQSFLRKLTVLLVCVLMHLVIYHLSIHHYTGWKTLYHTKIVLSFLPVLLFAQEDQIRARWGPAVWLLMLGAFAGIVLVSGERKAYAVLALLFMLSNAKPVSKILVPVAALGALAFFVIASPEDNYVRGRVMSVFEMQRQATMEELYAKRDIGYHSDAIRQFVNRNAREQFLAHPLFGLGATGYQAWATKQFGGMNNYGLTSNVHGEINRVPVENGIAGILVALCYFFCVTRNVMRHVRAKGGLAAASRDKLPLYVLVFMLPFMAAEALNSLMLAIILLFGFHAAALGRNLAPRLLSPEKRSKAAP